MKYSFLLVLIIMALSSCVKVDPFGLNSKCTGSCVTVMGRFTTSDNEPIANVPIAIRSERSRGSYELDIRLIADTRTDANGYYNISFAAKDFEWGTNASANIHLKYSYNESEYMPIYKFHKDIIISSTGDPIKSKDAVIIKNFYLPKIAKVNLHLTGFNPPINYQDNYFNVTAFCKAGADAKELPITGLQAENAVNTKQLLIAGNDSTRFHIERRKNGVNSTKDTMIYMPIATPTDVSFQF